MQVACAHRRRTYRREREKREKPAAYIYIHNILEQQQQQQPTGGRLELEALAHMRVSLGARFVVAACDSAATDFDFSRGRVRLGGRNRSFLARAIFFYIKLVIHAVLPYSPCDTRF